MTDKCKPAGYLEGLQDFFNTITAHKDAIGINNVEYLSVLFNALVSLEKEEMTDYKGFTGE